MPQYLFTYGTLRDPRVQRRVIGRVATSHPATLSGWRRVRVMIERVTYPAIIPSRGSSVRGTVVELTARELARFDAYETSRYRRVRVTTTDGTHAWTYRKS